MNLRLTKNRLKQIIKEELDAVMFEEYLEEDDGYFEEDQKWGGNKGEYKRKKGKKTGDEDGHYKDYMNEENMIQEAADEESLHLYQTISYWTKKLRDPNLSARQKADAKSQIDSARSRLASVQPGAGMDLGMGPRSTRDDDLAGVPAFAADTLRHGRDAADAAAVGAAAQTSAGPGGTGEFEHLGTGRHGKSSWGKHGDPEAQVDRSIDLTKKINRRLKGTSGYKEKSFKSLRRAINRARGSIGKPEWRRLRRLAYKDPAAASAGLKKALDTSGSGIPDTPYRKSLDLAGRD